jgi:hypothetical protein
VLDRLQGLRHDPVVGGHHQHHHIRGLGAARAHGGERGVARGVEKGDYPFRRADMVGADMLGDASGLAGGDPGAPDIVEQGSLAMVYMSHYSNNWWARQSFTTTGARGQLLLQRIFLEQLVGMAHFLDRQRGGFLIDDLVDGDHHAHLEEILDHLSGLDRHFLSQIGNANGLGQSDVTHHGRGWFGEPVTLLSQRGAFSPLGFSRPTAIRAVENRLIAASLPGHALGFTLALAAAGGIRFAAPLVDRSAFRMFPGLGVWHR